MIVHKEAEDVSWTPPIQFKDFYIRIMPPRLQLLELLDNHRTMTVREITLLIRPVRFSVVFSSFNVILVIPHRRRIHY